MTGFSPDGSGLFLLEFSPEYFVPFTRSELLGYNESPAVRGSIMRCVIGGHVRVQAPSGDWCTAERRQ